MIAVAVLAFATFLLVLMVAVALMLGSDSNTPDTELSLELRRLSRRIAQVEIAIGSEFVPVITRVTHAMHEFHRVMSGIGATPTKGTE